MGIGDTIRRVGERAITAMGGVTRGELDTRAAEAYAQGYNDSGEDEPPSGTTARFGYRRTTTGALRDFSQIDYGNILEIVWSLWQSNPVADRALEIKRDYICGRGIGYSVDDDNLRPIVDEFWRGNRMDTRSKEFALQLFLFGCQCFPAFVRETDGRVRLGYIDPGEIDEIIAHPDNAMEMWAVVVKEQQTDSEHGWVQQRGKRVYRIIREDEGAVEQSDADERVVKPKHPGLLVTAGQAVLEEWEEKMLGAYDLKAYTGSCFYEKVNSVSNQPRGYSDLLQEADWLDQHDETLFALADREQMAGYFSFDVTLTGADDAKVKTRAQELRASPPKKGSVNVHNENETWVFNYPDLKQNATIETQNALLTNVLGGLGLPRHWYGYGDETNRATAAAQGDPTWRSLEHDQDVVAGMLMRMLAFARDQAEIAGTWHPQADEETGEPLRAVITLTMPEMTSKDTTAVTASLGQMSLALQAAVDAGWITRETAAKAFAKVLAELDVEIDVTEELEKIDAGEELGAEAKAQTASDWLAQHGVMTGGEEETVGLSAELFGANA